MAANILQFRHKPGFVGIVVLPGDIIGGVVDTNSIQIEGKFMLQIEILSKAFMSPNQWWEMESIIW